MTAQTSRSGHLHRFYSLVASIVDLVARGARDAGTVGDLLEVVKENPNFAQALNLESAKAAALVVKANRREWKESTATSPFNQDLFPLAVNYDEPIASLVTQGRYDWANPDVTDAHFPTKRKGVVNLSLGRLVHFGRSMGMESVTNELGAMGLRAGETHELLAFGITFPEEQRKYPIVAPGSVWQDPDGYRNVPYLLRHGAGRGLGLRWIGSGWDERCRFLAFPK